MQLLQIKPITNLLGVHCFPESLLNMATPLSKQRSGHWVISKAIPTDVIVEVGDAHFPLHKFMLVSKSNCIRRLILESKDTELTRIDLSGMPGGPEIFETAVKFCYGVDFEITVQNVAALWCAAEYLQMKDMYSDNNLASLSESFLSEVALANLSGAILVLKSCEDLLPVAEELNLVQRCVEIVSAKACVEVKYPSHSPPNWWMKELSILGATSFGKIMASMKSRGARASTISRCLMTYAERSLHDHHVRDCAGYGIKSLSSDECDTQTQKHREVLESIVALLPSEKFSFPPNFLCFLLRAAIFLRADGLSKKDLERRISAILDHAKVDDLLVLSCTYDGERLFDVESVRRIISGFMDNENTISVFNVNFREECSVAVKRVAKIVDVYLAEIATYGELSVSKFNGIANLLPKAARKVDDDLYRAVDIYLKAHADLDEIEREKVCSVMDIYRLSYEAREARVHASENERLPVPIALQALCYDNLELRNNIDDQNAEDALAKKDPTHGDASLAEENELLRMELLEMKIYLSKNQGISTSDEKVKNQTFVSLKLRKSNNIKHGSKTTSNIDDGKENSAKSKRRFHWQMCRDI